MNQTLSCVEPISRWQNSRYTKLAELKNISSDEIIGKHYILELYKCNYSKLNDEAFVRTSLTSAAKAAGAKLLNLITHRFHPQGVTGLALLAESHISIHTWPEIKYAAVDVFTCGKTTSPEIACELLIREFCSEKYMLKNLVRETPSILDNFPREPELKS